MNDVTLTKGNALHSFYVVGIIYDLLLGESASACAERLDIDVSTVEKYFRLIRQRIAFNPSISKPLADTYPSANDEVWPAVFKCAFCEKGKIIEDEQASALSVQNIYEIRNLSKTRTNKTVKAGARCDECPFQEPVILDDAIYQQFFLERARNTKITADTFREHYFIFLLRDAIRFNRDAKNAGVNLVAKAIIDHLIENPL